MRLCSWTSCINAWLLSCSLENIPPWWMCKWVTQCFHCGLDSGACILVHALIAVMCWSHIDFCFLRMFKSHMFSHLLQWIFTSVASVSVTDMWLRMKLLQPSVGLNYFDGLGFGVSVVDIIEYSCNMEGVFLHFVLSFNINHCRWLRSGSLVVFTVSASWDGRMPHGYRMHRVCRIKCFFCGSNSWSSQKGRFL